MALDDPLLVVSLPKFRQPAAAGSFRVRMSPDFVGAICSYGERSRSIYGEQGRTVIVPQANSRCRIPPRGTACLEPAAKPLLTL